MRTKAKQCARMREHVPGKPVACRKCDYCLGRRANYWTARAMMEKAVSVDTLVLTLTYGSDSEAAIDGAKQFHYAHVRLFMQNLRDAVDAKLGYQGGLRFVSCGETGDRVGRVHWHLVLFSQTCLTDLGEWRASFGVITDRHRIVSPEGKQYRCQWSMWPHGLVMVQEPDQGGMRYAMSYAIKDQFSIENAEGTARAATAEFDAAGYFRPSRGRPLGAAFIDKYLQSCAAAGSIGPSCRVSVPGLNFPVGLVGKLREQLLVGYRQINDARRAEHGTNCNAWSSLVYQSRNIESDMRLLGILPPEETDLRRNCGSSLPCSECLSSLSDQARAGHHVVQLDGGEAVLSADFRRLCDDEGEPPAPTTWRFPEWLAARERFGRLQSDGSRKSCHPDCQLRGSKLLEAAFGAGFHEAGPPVLADRRFAGR